MAGPLDIVLAIHKAFRRDMFEIDDAAYKIVEFNDAQEPVILYSTPSNHH